LIANCGDRPRVAEMQRFTVASPSMLQKANLLRINAAGFADILVTARIDLKTLPNAFY
jgi:hypothetical protein